MRRCRVSHAAVFIERPGSQGAPWMLSRSESVVGRNGVVDLRRCTISVQCRSRPFCPPCLDPHNLSRVDMHPPSLAVRLSRAARCPDCAHPTLETSTSSRAASTAERDPIVCWEAVSDRRSCRAGVCDARAQHLSTPVGAGGLGQASSHRGRAHPRADVERESWSSRRLWFERPSEKSSCSTNPANRLCIPLSTVRAPCLQLKHGYSCIAMRIRCGSENSSLLIITMKTKLISLQGENHQVVVNRE